LSLKIEADLVKGGFTITLEHMRQRFHAKDLDEIAAAVSHYFRFSAKIHEEYARRNLCPLCEQQV